MEKIEVTIQDIWNASKKQISCIVTLTVFIIFNFLLYLNITSFFPKAKQVLPKIHKKSPDFLGQGLNILYYFATLIKYPDYF